MKQYGVILIGCGHIGLEHLADIHFRDNIRMIAVIDQKQEAARSAAARYGVAEYGTDWRCYLDDDRVDIALVATYTDSHPEISLAFLRKGKHVLCEKPVASTPKEGRRFFAEAEQCEGKLLIAHVLRHNETYRKAAELIRGGAIGELTLIRMVQNHHAMNWERYKRLLQDCTPALDCGVHYFDVVRWFTGQEFREMRGFGSQLDVDSPNINYTLTQFTLENGCIGYYEAGWSCHTASNNRKEFVGTKGRLELTLSGNRAECREEGDLITVFHSDTGVYETINVQAEYKNMYAQLMALIDRIEKGTEGFPSMADAARAFDAAAAAEYAVKSGKTVAFVNGIPALPSAFC
jgi:predicted dehydrogenase